MPVNVFAAYISALLLFAAGSVLVTRRLQAKFRWLMILLVVTGAILLPSPDNSLMRWLAAATGELSIPTVVLLCGYILRRQTGVVLLDRQARVQLYLWLLLAGVVLYPASLGLGMVDPYRIGYDIWLSLLMAALALVYLLLRRYSLGMLFMLVLVTAESGVFGSVNTWDYLLDPLIWIASPVLLLVLYFNGRKAAA
jgi:hypothetical protein